MRARFLLAALALTACGDDRPPAPTAAENAQLDEAGDMLDNEEGAAPEDTAPSNLANEGG